MIPGRFAQFKYKPVSILFFMEKGLPVSKAIFTNVCQPGSKKTPKFLNPDGLICM